MIRGGRCSLSYKNTRKKDNVLYCQIGRRVYGAESSCVATIEGNPHHCRYMPQDLLVEHESQKYNLAKLKTVIMTKVEENYRACK